MIREKNKGQLTIDVLICSLSMLLACSSTGPPPSATSIRSESQLERACAEFLMMRPEIAETFRVRRRAGYDTTMAKLHARFRELITFTEAAATIQWPEAQRSDLERLKITYIQMKKLLLRLIELGRQEVSRGTESMKRDLEFLATEEGRLWRQLLSACNIDQTN
jgi:hypothetical protein